MSKQTDHHHSQGFYQAIWRQYRKHPFGVVAAIVLSIVVFAGIYAPFLASDKPLFVVYDGHWYFPLFRYLFFTGFYRKPVDIFMNIGMFLFPVALISCYFRARIRRLILLGLFVIQSVFLSYLLFAQPIDPAVDISLEEQRAEALKTALQFENGRAKKTRWEVGLDWNFDLRYQNDYAKLLEAIDQDLKISDQKRLLVYQDGYRELVQEGGVRDHKVVTDQELQIPTLLNKEAFQEGEARKSAQSQVTAYANATTPEDLAALKEAQYDLLLLDQKQAWRSQNYERLGTVIYPFVCHNHWDADIGGNPLFNQVLPWYETSRTNGHSLLAGLIFGVRISLSVGILSVAIALMIGLPIGAFAGYFGGRFDIIVSRLLEVWEAMPTFFMLLLITAMLQTKSIFLVVAVIGFFDWTGFSRYLRGEFFKQRNLPYVEACHALGFHHNRIIFGHIMPNAIPPLLTLLPFSIMGAIEAEAGLSFLGLGEEGSCSWGILMNEGRLGFPAESYRLWPPAIFLTILLVAIALIGDALRDAIDPKMRRD